MRSTRRLAKAGLALLLVLAALSLLTGLELSEVVTALGNASPTLLALSVVVYLVSWPLRGLRYRWILRAMRHDESTALMTGAVFVSQTANLVLPARAGDGLRAVIVNRRGVPYRTGIASLAVERLSDLAAVIGIGVMGLAAAWLVGVETPQAPLELQPSPWLLLVPLVAAAAFVLVFKTGLLDGFVADLRRGVTGTGFVWVLVVGAAVWVVDAAVAVLVLSSLGVGLDPGLVAVGFVAVSAGNVAKIVPVTPGGVGAYEAAFVAVVAVAGVGWGVAVAAAVLDHLVKNAVTVVGGVVSSVVLDVGFGEWRKEDLSG